MKSLVIYESAYGNTKQIAEAIAEVLGRYGPCAARTPATARDGFTDVDLLVVGCPTHAWGMPWRRTWPAKDAAPAPKPLLRDWLRAGPRGRGRPAVAFATRLGGSRWFTGSAAGGVARRLSRRGWKVVARRSFVVLGASGPIDPGELDAARQWALEVADSVAPAAAKTNRA